MIKLLNPILLALLMLPAALLATAGGLDDPFSVKAMVAGSPADAGICDDHAEGRALTLADVIQISLCSNPQTRAAWASTRNAAAQFGASHSSRLPTLSLQGSASHDATVTGTAHSVSNRQGASLSLSYLLYDFGGREAAIDNARELLAAANASGNTTIQTIFLDAAQAYFSLMSARASVEANVASETAARESLAAAEARYQAGATTPADRLQARTALSQATLARIRAEGAMHNALGTVANVMGVEPTTPLVFAPSSTAAVEPDVTREENVGRLIADALQQRPDLAAAEARIRAAEAAVASARADGMPQLTLDASAAGSRNAAAGGAYTNTRNGAIALNITFPIFTGFNTGYRTQAAEAELESSIATRDQAVRQVELQVWQAYQNLRTEGEALRATEYLLASAGESEAMNLGRYREGVGNVIDLLSAQSAMASARQQHVTALYNWHAARFSLAQAIGALDLSALQMARRMEQ